MSAPARRWLVSPAFDLGWFLCPGLLALIAGVALGLYAPVSANSSSSAPESLGLWIGGVVLVDVAHVWSSLYRTWLDPGARVRHADLLRATPLVVFGIGLIAHLISPALFWSALAYLAVFHFIKQQEGIASLYLRAEAISSTAGSGAAGSGASGSAEIRQRRLTKAAIWASTLGPVLYWHANLPRQFSWFMPGDFLPGLTPVLGTVALWVQVPIVVAFVIARIARGRAGHPMLTAWVLLTALSWNVGIVWFNDDRVFTLTNVFVHGVPYMALVWAAGGRERVVEGLGLDVRGRASARAWIFVAAAGFYALLLALAVVEETLWDRLVWHDREFLFGVGRLDLDDIGVALVVAVLTVPQATHYILDRYIWRPGSSNPELAGQLGLEP